MIYLLDANIFIEAKNRYYGFDFCPAFWDWLVEQNRVGKVASIARVGDELDAGDDDLTLWAKARGADFFTKPDNSVADALVVVGRWAQGAGYSPKAVSGFLESADYWLVAHAKARGCVVVSHEVSDRGAGKIKIPDVCEKMSLRCIDPYKMLRQKKARFVLESMKQAA